MSTPTPILDRLLHLHPKKIDLSLDRMTRLLASLGDPQTRLPPVIHVAGTNGKGSTIAFMRAILEAAGLAVHVYTSPHLVRFNERIRLAAPSGGKLVSDEALDAAFEAVEAANGASPLTFFEATTAAAFRLFSNHPADALLLEVGLGGRLDATNVLEKPACAVITPVSRDHVEFLGETLEAIAAEKAGIVKRGAPAVFAKQDNAVQEVLERQAARLSAPAFVWGRDYLCRREADRMVYEDGQGLLDLPLPKLAGTHQIENAGVAIAALRCAFPEAPLPAFERGLGAANWPARLQNLCGGRLAALAPKDSELWLDGGHNVAGAEALAAAMAERNALTPMPLVLVYSSLKSKDAEGFIRQFAAMATKLIAVPIHGDQASWPPNDIVSMAQKFGLTSGEDVNVESALKNLTAKGPLRILIAGSLYLSGDVLTANATPPA